MYCYCCKEFYLVNRHFHELLLPQRKKGICPKCLRAIKLKYSLIVMPLDDGFRLFNINLYTSLPTDDFNYFFKSFSLAYKYLIKLNIGFVLPVDYFNEDEIEYYRALQKIVNSDIIVVSFLLKTL